MTLMELFGRIVDGSHDIIDAIVKIVEGDEDDDE